MIYNVLSDPQTLNQVERSLGQRRESMQKNGPSANFWTVKTEADMALAPSPSIDWANARASSEVLRVRD